MASGLLFPRPTEISIRRILRRRGARRNVVQPSVSAASISDGELVAAGLMRFTITLDPAALETVAVSWATVAGTAVPPSDFTHASGTLTFAPGDTTGTVDVPVRSADQATEERFTVVLSDPVNCTITDGTGIGILPGVLPPVIPVISIGNITI